MFQADQIQLGLQFNPGEEYQYKVKIDIDVGVSLYTKRKIKVD